MSKSDSASGESDTIVLPDDPEKVASGIYARSHPAEASVRLVTGARDRQARLSNDVIRTISRIDALGGVEAFSGQLAPLVGEWNQLLEHVNETGKLIMNAIRSDECANSLEAKLSNMSAMAAVSEIAGHLRSFPVSHESCELSSDGEGLHIEQMVLAVREVRNFHQENMNETARRVDKLKAVLADEVEKLLCSVNMTSGKVPTDQVAFLLESSTDEIDAIRRTNSMRWLNDVLKWQILDLNTQIHNGVREGALKASIEAKKTLITEIIHSKVQQSSSLHKIKTANETLTHALDSFYKISTASSVNTASSTPPTTSVQMIQSPAVKLEEVEAFGITADMNPSLGY
jgi:hypothetical protein